MNPAAALIRVELIKEFQYEKLQCSRHQTTDMKNHFLLTFYRKSNATPQSYCLFLGNNFGTSENISNMKAIAKKITFLFKFTSIICSFSFFKMYLEMNMSKYSSAKYSQVEDQAEFEENPAGRTAQAENRPIPPHRNFKSTSLRQPRNNQEGEIV